MNTAEFEALLERYATAQSPRPDTLAGLALARTGRVVSLGDAPAAPALPAGAVPIVGEPAPYRLTQWTDAGDGWIATNDRLELDIHGAASMTHIDAISHFGPPQTGDPLLELAATGLVGRGVLVDVPGVLGLDIVGRPITLAEFERALDTSGVELRRGDILHVHLGRQGRARSDVPLGSQPTSGLSIECADRVASAGLAAIVTDEGLDPMPSEVDGHPVPWHVLVLTALRIPLIDRATLTALAAACAEEQRWEFLTVIAPLPIPTASGSPVNPLAIF